MRRIKAPAVGALLIVALAAGAPRIALAKGPDFYAPLTIGLIGAGGARSFDASSGADGQAAWELVQQVQMAAVGQSAALAAPSLHNYYEITIHQDGAPLNRLPWYGTPTAQFFFYRGNGSTPDYLRLHMARISEPVRDTWLLAAPSLSAMLQRHLTGLSPVAPAEPGLSAPWLWPVLILTLALGALWLVGRRHPHRPISWTGHRLT